MIRDIDMSEISDGKRYTCNDMVKVGCNDCSGCSACCRDMEAIILDPYDAYNMTKGLNCTFTQLLQANVEIGLVDGLILPNIRMNPDTNACNFLDENGRCSIHQFRSGICRLFPLGRIYEDNGFKYFLQTNECKKTNLSKVKISKWLGVQDLKKYEEFILKWHNFLKAVETDVKNMDSPDKVKQIGMTLLQLFYIMPYDTDKDFYTQFEERLSKLEEV